MNFTQSEIIDAYTNALLPFAGEINLDNSISTENQIETLSAVLNSVSAINEIIPVDLHKLNKFDMKSALGKKLGGLYSPGKGYIRLTSMSEKVTRPQIIAINLAHEYGHYVYDSIIASNDVELHKKLESLIKDMGEVFLNSDEEKLKKYENMLRGGPNSRHKNNLEYLSEPTEMFARAFSGFVLKDVEKSYSTGTCFPFNYTASELDVFSDKLSELCESFKEHMLNNYYETDHKLFSNINDKEEAIIYKTEGALLEKSMIKHAKTNFKSKDFAGENIVRQITSNTISKNFSKTKKDVLQYSPNEDFIMNASYDEHLDNFYNMNPAKVYRRKEEIQNSITDCVKSYNKYMQEIESLKESIKLDPTNYKLQRRLNTVQYLQRSAYFERENLEIENKALLESNVTETREYKRYSKLKNKEKALNDFINKFDCKTVGKFYSPIENLKIVQDLKDKIVNKLDMRVSSIVNEINQYEEVEYNSETTLSKRSVGGTRPHYAINYKNMEDSLARYNEFKDILPPDHVFMEDQVETYNISNERANAFTKVRISFNDKARRIVDTIKENKANKSKKPIDIEKLSQQEYLDYLIEEARKKEALSNKEKSLEENNFTKNKDNGFEL